MDRRELLATGGVSLVAIAGCLGTYEVARRTVPSDDSTDTDATDDSGEDRSSEGPLNDEDGPLADSNESNETDEGGDELEESDESDDEETDDNEDEEESADPPEERPEDPIEHLTWLERDTEAFDEPGYEGEENFVVGELRNDTGHDLAYLVIVAQGLLEDEIITENGTEVAGLPAGESLTFEIPLGVEPDEMDAFRLGVVRAEYLEFEG